MSAKGYARRSPSPPTGGARIITVTPGRRDAVAAGHEVADRVHQDVLEALPEDQRTAFTESLSSLVSGLLAEPLTSGGQCAGRGSQADPARNHQLRDC